MKLVEFVAECEQLYDIKLFMEMEYTSESGSYNCRNGKKPEADSVKHSKSTTGYVSEKTIYKCKDCNGCPYKCRLMRTGRLTALWRLRRICIDFD